MAVSRQSLEKTERLLLSLALVCLSSCSHLISQRIPNDVKIEQSKYVSEGWGGRDGSHLYQWPADEYHTQMFDRWWNETRYMGTIPILPYGEGRYKFYFSPSMYISFSGSGASDYVMFTYVETIDRGGCFVREVRPVDKALIREIINIARDSKTINTEYLRFEDFKSKYWKK